MTRGPRAPKRSPTIPDGLQTDVPSLMGSGSPLTPGTPVYGKNGTSSGRSPDLEKERQGPPPLYLSKPFVSAALVKGNFKTIVMLPKWVDVNEWVAINST